MPISIGTKKLIPAPLVTFNKQLTFTDDGRPISSIYNITLEGTLLPNKGSPTSQGWYTGPGSPSDESFTTDEDRFNSLLAKQELMREAFTVPGFKLSYSPPTKNPVEFYPTVKSMSFDKGQWVSRADYVIELETAHVNRVGSAEEDIFLLPSGATASSLFAVSGFFLDSISDNIAVRERDDGSSILDVERIVSAKSHVSYNASGVTIEPWKIAKAWVDIRLAGVPLNSGDSRFIATTGRYNLVQEESINKFAGEYSVSQRYLYSPSFSNYREDRQISKTYNPNLTADSGSPLLTQITVNGNIIGFDPSNNVSGRLDNARAYWNTISDGVAIGLAAGAYGNPISWSYNEDQGNGIIGYSFNYTNNSGIYPIYKHNYNVSYNIGNNDLPTVVIQGNIEGQTWDGRYIDASGNNKFVAATSGWNILKPQLKTLAFAETSLFTGSANYLNLPVIKAISFDKPNGTITYSYTFGYTSSSISDEFVNNYNIEFTTANTKPDSGGNNIAGYLVSATINGTIQGLTSTATPDDPTTRITNAKTAWDTVQASLFTLVNNEYSLIGDNKPPLYSGFVNRTVNINNVQGILTYSASFNNLPAPSGGTQVATEEITAEDNYSNDVFVAQPIPGRAAGPIFQNIGTVTEKRRNINVSMTMHPKNATPTVFWTFADKPTVAAIASGLVATMVPAGTRGTNWFISGDTDNWNWKSGLYTRTVNFTYI